jgi:hypothetical protein
LTTRRHCSIPTSPGKGLREGWVCHGREEVIDTFRWGLEKRRDVDALEFTRAGDRVVLGARGSSITEVGDEPLEGQIFNVFHPARRPDRAHRRLPAPRRGARRSRRHSGYRLALIKGRSVR